MPNSYNELIAVARSFWAECQCDGVFVFAWMFFCTVHGVMMGDGQPLAHTFQATSGMLIE